MRMIRAHPQRAPARRPAPALDAMPPIGDSDRVQREVMMRDGSARLLGRIEVLVGRTAERLAIPMEWQHRKIDFARAYLGMEVADDARPAISTKEGN